MHILFFRFLFHTTGKIKIQVTLKEVNLIQDYHRILG